MQWVYAIDAGGSMLRGAAAGQPDAFRESSLVAARGEQSAPIAWGDKALGIYGREPEGVHILRAVKDGVPADVGLLARWVKRLYGETDKRSLRKTGVLLALSPAARPDVRDALEGRVIEEGVPGVGLVRSDIACAIGAGADVMQPRCTMLVDVGDGHMTASLIAGGRVVRSEALPFGMGRAEERLMNAVRERLGCAIGPHTARALTHELGAIKGMSGDATSVKPVFDFASSLPRNREIPAELVQSCVGEVVRALMDLLARVTAFAPAALAGDLTEHGMLLAGGGAHLFGLDLHIRETLGIDAAVAEAPEECVIRGLWKIMNSRELASAFVTDVKEDTRR